MNKLNLNIRPMNKALLVFLLLLIIPINLESGFNPLKSIGNVLRGDPLNIGGGGKSTVRSLDAVLTKHVGSLTEIQKAFAKDNLKLIDEFHKGNAENIKVFNENNKQLIDQFDALTIKFSENIESGFNSNIEFLSTEATTVLDTEGNKFSYRFNLSILFFVFALFVFVLLLMSYGYYLFVVKSRKSLFKILISKSFLQISGVGFFVGMMFYMVLYLNKANDIDNKIEEASIDFYEGRLSEAYKKAKVLKGLPQSRKKMEHANFLFDKYFLALELFKGPSWLRSENISIELKNKEYLKLLEYKLDSDLLTMQAYWNWLNAENKSNRQLAKALAIKALKSSEDFALRNIAIDIINGENRIYDEIKQEVSGLIEDRLRIESLLQGSIEEIAETEMSNLIKTDLAIFGISNREQNIINKLIDFRSLSNSLYVELLTNSNENENVANKIITEYDALIDYFDSLGPNGKEDIISYQNLINNNILLEAYSTKIFGQPIGFSELNKIPQDTIINIYDELSQKLVKRKISGGFGGIGKMLSRSMARSIANHLKTLEKLNPEKFTTAKTIKNPDKTKVEEAFRNFNEWRKRYTISLGIQHPNYLEGLFESLRLEKMLMVDSHMRLVKSTIYSNVVNGQQLSNEEFFSLCEVLNILGLHKLKTQIRDTQSNLEDFNAKLIDSEKISSLIKLEI